MSESKSCPRIKRLPQLFEVLEKAKVHPDLRREIFRVYFSDAKARGVPSVAPSLWRRADDFEVSPFVQDVTVSGSVHPMASLFLMDYPSPTLLGFMSVAGQQSGRITRLTVRHGGKYWVPPGIDSVRASVKPREFALHSSETADFFKYFGLYLHMTPEMWSFESSLTDPETFDIFRGVLGSMIPFAGERLVAETLRDLEEKVAAMVPLTPQDPEEQQQARRRSAGKKRPRDTAASQFV